MLRGYSAFLLLTVISYGSAIQAQIVDREDVQSFIQKMVSEHDFNARHLRDMFSDVRESDSVLKAISKPAEALPWYQYRTIFLRNDRIRHGVRFLKKNKQALERAEQEYGVPAEVITAIIGVETRYGKQKGGYRVLDSLSTLAFDYPPRSDFFLGELEQFLLLTREQGLDPRKVMGSYAGAMGIPQFIASSYRRYAVDFDGDGKIDIWDSSADAIGSVANYFKAHGWLPGGLIAVPALVSGDDYRELLSEGLKPDIDVARLPVYGIFPQQALQGGEEYWLGLENFYVITRYNHSALYAMAAYQLAEAIKHRYQDHLAEN
jgi:membrane-bound lytic murein transglycosylase B